MLLSADRSCLLVVDIQTRLLPAMAEPDRVVVNTGKLIESAHHLAVPILASEQYPRGIGATVADVADRLPADAVVEKTHFSCLRDTGFAKRFAALDRPQAVIAGIEAHICVLQTSLDLLSAGHDVYVVADATSSRVPFSHQTAMARLQAAGASIVTTEMVVYEWLERAATPAFKALSPLLK